MTDRHDESVIIHYLAEFERVAAKAENGDDVSELITILAENALKNLDIWSNGMQTDNKSKLVVRLRKKADLVARASPRAAKALIVAAEMLKNYRKDS